MSLNNLEINASRLMSVNNQSSVDECLSQGAQDMLFEDRPTSLLTPVAIGSLEFSALFPVTPVTRITAATDSESFLQRRRRSPGHSQPDPHVYQGFDGLPGEWCGYA